MRSIRQSPGWLLLFAVVVGDGCRSNVELGPGNEPDVGHGGAGGARFVSTASEICRPNETPSVDFGTTDAGEFTPWDTSEVTQLGLRIARAGGFVIDVATRTTGLSATEDHENSLTVELEVDRAFPVNAETPLTLLCSADEHGEARVVIGGDRDRYRTVEQVEALAGKRGTLRIQLTDHWGRLFKARYSVELVVIPLS